MNQLKFYLLSLLIFVTLIYSTSLHYATGTEQTMNLRFLFYEPHEKCKKFGNEEGILLNKNVNIWGDNVWKLSGFPHDVMEYLNQANEFGAAGSPFKYRITAPFIAKLISVTIGTSLPYSFLVMNIIFTLATACLFVYYLQTIFNFSNNLSLIGGILFITMVSNTRTIPFPMTEPVSFFFTMLIFISVANRNILLFIISSIIGVAAKETLVFAAVLWFVNYFDLNIKNIVKTILISLVPILAFGILRLILGGHALEVNFGFDLAQGQFPSYWKRLINGDSLLSLINLVFLSFSFLWLGLINLRKNVFLLKSSVIIPLVILAAVLLSAQITRVIGVVFPLIIPLFLLFFQKQVSE